MWFVARSWILPKRLCSAKPAHTSPLGPGESHPKRKDSSLCQPQHKRLEAPCSCDHDHLKIAARLGTLERMIEPNLEFTSVSVATFFPLCISLSVLDREGAEALAFKVTLFYVPYCLWSQSLLRWDESRLYWRESNVSQQIHLQESPKAITLGKQEGML